MLSAIAKVERAYQEELEMGFGRLSEGEFKGLRRQLPVTRQKVEWEKIGGYRVSAFLCFPFSSWKLSFADLMGIGLAGSGYWWWKVEIAVVCHAVID